jgi:hypothetical protein
MAVIIPMKDHMIPKTEIKAATIVGNMARADKILIAILNHPTKITGQETIMNTKTGDLRITMKEIIPVRKINR